MLTNKKIIGIDLGGTNVRAGLISNNELINITSAAIDAQSSEKGVLNTIFSLIEKYINEEIDGIGIGVPSVVDTEKGIVYDVQNIPSWKEVQLKSIMETKYGLPVFINNDANCFALAEKYFGKGKTAESFIGLIIGTGLGAGIIINNRLYEGRNCGAGEIGMLPYLDSIFENYCSGQFFRRKYNLSGEEVNLLAKQNNLDAINILAEFGSHLGNAIKTLLYMFDPEMIILGGSVTNSYNFFENSMRETLKDFAYSNTITNLKIEVSETEYAGVLGAAALVFQQMSFPSTSHEEFY
jgi:glucokinase